MDFCKIVWVVWMVSGFGEHLFRSDIEIKKGSRGFIKLVDIPFDDYVNISKRGGGYKKKKVKPSIRTN
jgi:hypothetical protein